MSKFWTQTEERFLRENWHRMTKQEAIESFPDRSYKSIERKAQSLGLRKSGEWQEKISSLQKNKEVNGMKKLSKKDKKELSKKIVRDSVRQVAKELPKCKRFKSLRRTKSRRKIKKETWLLQLSDFHDGLVVKKVQLGGLGEYNPEIGAKRLHRLAKSLVRILDYTVQPPDQLVIAFQGDNIDNAIMRGQQYGQVEYGILRQVTNTTELYLEFLMQLTKFFPKIRCFGVPGNHGRMTKKPTDAIPMDNFDNLIYYMMKERLKGVKGVRFDYEPEMQHMIVDIRGYLFWIQHGDTVRSWAGIPFYGSIREIKNINQILGKYDTHVPYVLTAHHHSPAEFEGVIMNGSFPGGDTYSIGRLRRMSLPSQNLMGISSGHGIVWKRKIDLITKPKKEDVKIYKVR